MSTFVRLKRHPGGIIAAGILVAALSIASLASAASKACIPDVPLVDSHGQPFDPASLKGKATLLDFVHTSCPGVCMTLTGKFSDVARKLGPQMGSDVMLLSVSNDPEHDNPAQLLKLARKHGADQSGWYFVTGKPDDVAKMLQAFGLNGKEPDGEPAHIPQVFLLGPDGCTVHDYNGIIMKPKLVADQMRQAASVNQAKVQTGLHQHL